MRMVTLRCAIYTRKSTEEGLEQEFNSLDAQRESCAAYVMSQAGQGWKEIRTHYDDGGISGGTMERPALQDLLQDIKSGKVDVVVVYKIDRLTRSLIDFAKIVEVFDAHKVSFVSVTQQFNTLSSMGRLTLNVLLSFAQFEREVTAERIRDKIAASKRKGMWMGGAVPMGFIAKDKKLVIDPVEAEVVKKIFRLYRDVGSVQRVKEHLDQVGNLTKQRVWKDGTASGGKPFTRGHLYWLLSNPVYAGLVSHKGVISDGQHDAIIDRETWDTTQGMLAGSAPFERQALAARDAPAQIQNGTGSILAGLLYDETGDRLSPSHAVKNGIRYRYYISQRLMRARRKDASGWRLPAKPLEELVVAELASLLADHRQIQTMIGTDGLTIQELETVTGNAKLLCNRLLDQPGIGTKAIIRSLVDCITLEPGKLTLAIDRKSLTAALGVKFNGSDFSIEHHLHEVAFALRRRGVEAKLVLGATAAQATFVDPVLVDAISQGHIWVKQLSTGLAKSAAEIAAGAGTDDGEVTRVLPLAFLAPDIVEMILGGRQPVTLTARYLKRLKPIPTSWFEQRRVLGFGSVYPR